VRVSGEDLARCPAAPKAGARENEVRAVKGDMNPDDYSVNIDGQDPCSWAGVLDAFSDASIYQTWPYGEVRWGRTNMSHVVLSEGGRTVAAAQVRIFRVPLLPAGIAYVAYGPMWKSRAACGDIESFRRALRALVREYAQSRRMILRVRPWGVRERDPDMESVLLEEGFRITEGIRREKTRTILVDLGPTEEELRKSLKKKWRQTLQHAERAGLRVIDGCDGRLFEDMKPIYAEMLEQKKFTPGSDIHEFAAMQGRLLERQRMRVTICKNGTEPVSASLCSGIGDTVVGLVSATGAAGRDLQAYYLLQWEEILWSKRAGKILYDLGGINPDVNPGVYRFKAGLGGEEVTYLGVWDYCENKRLYKALMCAERALGTQSANTAKVRSFFPDRLLRAGSRAGMMRRESADAEK